MWVGRSDEEDEGGAIYPLHPLLRDEYIQGRLRMGKQALI